MKALILGLFLFAVSVQATYAQNADSNNATKADQELIDLSKEKWSWMANRKPIGLPDYFMKSPCLFTWAVLGEKSRKLRSYER